jgi:ubiquinone/menaquinone biosynthesis C-methylase UbiE/DNA-binding transcriptional ArsR family regulator
MYPDGRMNKTTHATSSRPDALLGWMESLADATRLRLLRLLERHELGVVELCDVLQLPQSTVSRHLKVLSDQHWTRSRRQATTNLYRTILDELDPTARKLWILAREQTGKWATTQQDESRLLRHLRDKQNDSQAFFAGAASLWDKLRGELYGSRFTTAAMLSLLPSDYVVADLGCGTGPLTADLAHYVKQVIAVDNSAAMLKAAQKRLEAFDNIDLRRGDLEALPIDDRLCDAAMMVLVLTYVASPQTAIHEMARILKPGGKAVLLDLLPHDREDFRRQMEQQHPGFSSESAEKMLTDAGFANVMSRPLPPEANVRGPALFLATGTKAISTSK